jgi:hypothetical protein
MDWYTIEHRINEDEKFQSLGGVRDATAFQEKFIASCRDFFLNYLDVTMYTKMLCEMHKGKDGAFGAYNGSDFWYINHYLPSAQLSKDDRELALACYVGCYRAQLVSQMNENAVSYLAAGDFVTMEARVAGVAGPVIKKSLHENRSRIIREIGKKRNSYTPAESFRLSMSLPVKATYAEGFALLNSLFPEGMFHSFTDEEILFVSHLAPGREDGLFRKLFSRSPPPPTDTEKDVFIRCMVGVMRSRAKGFCRVNIGAVEWSDGGAGVRLGTADKDPADDLRSIYRGIAAKIVQDELTSRHFLIDPNMDNSVIDVSKVPANKRERLESVRNALAESKDGNLLLSADNAMFLLGVLFPEGMFHMYNGAEYALVNLLCPVERPLIEDESLFWMECIVGAERSRIINEGAADPLKDFKWEKHLKASMGGAKCKGG